MPEPWWHEHRPSYCRRERSDCGGAAGPLEPARTLHFNQSVNTERKLRWRAQRTRNAATKTYVQESITPRSPCAGRDALLGASTSGLDGSVPRTPFRTLMRFGPEAYIGGAMRGKRVGAAILAFAVGLSSSAFCEEAFTGETAAYVDWAVKNCEFKGSDKTRQLVEQLKAKGDTAFSSHYMKGFYSKEIAAANADRTGTENLCTKMSDWYGRSGSKIAGLVVVPSEPAQGTDARKSPVSADSKGGRRRRNQQ